MKQMLPTLIFGLTLVACGGSDTDLETAFCDGLEAPAARSVSAAETADGAEDVTDAARVDIELNEAESGFGGYVTYVPDEAGSFAFGLTEDVDIIVRDQAGAEVPLTKTVAGSSQCDALAVRHTVALELAPYTLEIQGAQANVIGLIAEESDDDL